MSLRKSRTCHGHIQTSRALTYAELEALLRQQVLRVTYAELEALLRQQVLRVIELEATNQLLTDTTRNLIARMSCKIDMNA